MSCKPKIVFVGKVPGQEKQYIIAEEKVTVARALEVAEITMEQGYNVQVNGTQVDADTEVQDGDKILLVKVDEIITVTVGMSPGMTNKIQINGRKKVRDAFAGVGINVEEYLEKGFVIRVGDNPANPDTDLQDGNMVMLIPQCEGN